MEITKSNYKCKCRKCYGQITTKYRVVQENTYYHLSCYFEWVEGRLREFKERRRKLVRYKKHMIMERL